MNERASKADQVYESLKTAILSGGLEPGAPIDKLELCERLGVSRFPVSAAISRLAYDQLVRVEPQHGSFVARISARDVLERLFIRRALEGEIAAEAARRLDAETRAALADNIAAAQRAVESDNRAGFYELDVAFHALFTRGLGLPRSAELLDGLRVHLERVRRMLLAPTGRIQATLNEHRTIVEAVQSGDPTRARSAMEAHLTVVVTMFANFSRARPELFTD